jgi:alpha-beta hydrolase superfamily lysophospholipase
MTRVKKGLLTTIVVYFTIYILTVTFFVFTQEKFFFHPEKLQKNYKYNFKTKFEELNFLAADDTLLNGILFKADSSKGLIFYLHGNAGSLKSYDQIARIITGMNWDLFVLDYRGFGKSGGSIRSENELYSDIQIVYDKLKSRYDEKNIIMYGYSLGTGLAAKLASTNNPRILILQAPYYSWTDLFRHRCPVIPTFLVKYKIATNKYIGDCKMPVIIFHGDMDKVVYYKSSLKLMKLTKPGNRLITLHGAGHIGISNNMEYLAEIRKILN